MVAVVVCASLAWLAPDFASLSQDLDPLVYQNIAMRLMQGEGGFWMLPYFESNVVRFTDHPPLGIFTVSLWYSMFGSGLLATKLLIITILSAVMLAQRDLARLTGIPVWTSMLLFVVMPLTLATLTELYLEGMLTLTTLLAVAACWRAQQNRLWSILFGLMVYVGFLIKGPVALFALAAPLGLWWYQGRFLQPLVIAGIALAIALVLFVLTLISFPDAQVHFSFYLENQVLASVLGERTIQNNRLDQLGEWSKQVAIAGLVLAALAKTVTFPKVARFWLILSLSGSLPLLISSRHYSHYLLPALPFLALTLASCIQPRTLPSHYRLPAIGLLGVVAIMLFVTNLGGNGRHDRDLAAVEVIETVVPMSEPIAFCPEDRSLHIRAFLAAYRGRDLHHVTNAEAANMWLICTHPLGRRDFNVPMKKGIRIWAPSPELVNEHL
ncbi:MAG: hypothetical protein VYE04_17000 [Pseudomonadota bacterium]|nr:hypothetical protein [Pseudomonadota bacterium]